MKSTIKSYFVRALVAGAFMSSLETTAQQALPYVHARAMAEATLVTTMEKECRLQDREQSAIYLPSRKQAVQTTDKSLLLDRGYSVIEQQQVVDGLLVNMNEVTVYHCHPANAYHMTPKNSSIFEFNLLLPSLNDIEKMVGQRALAVANRPDSTTRFRIVTDDLSGQLHVIEFGTLASLDEELRSIAPKLPKDKTAAQSFIERWNRDVLAKAKQTSGVYDRMRLLFEDSTRRSGVRTIGYAQLLGFSKVLDAAHVGIYVKEVYDWK